MALQVQDYNSIPPSPPATPNLGHISLDPMLNMPNKQSNPSTNGFSHTSGTSSPTSHLSNGGTNGTNGVHKAENKIHTNMKVEEVSHQVDSFGLHTSSPGARVGSKLASYSDDNYGTQFPRISKHVELMRNEYDCVVIGSGYGGGVAASRMARGDQSVCLLERGKERWPGEYPAKFTEAMKELHVSGDFAPGFLDGCMVEGGDPTGLYHLVVGKGQNAFVGNGLGGTSLLNANVFRETDERTMALGEWPQELRKPGELNKYYKRARDMLQPERYPEDWPELPKLSLLEKQAKALGFEEKFERVEQTTRFVNGANSTGIEMFPSALTGQDSTGVNDGSKSSTLVNYLSDAWNWGAEMFCQCEVRYIKKHPDKEGYLVYFAWHGSKRGSFPHNLYEDLMWVHAKKCVFVGAGSLGTTEILLRSKSLGLAMSAQVGRTMSGNGDILAFGYNCNEEANAMGREQPSTYRPIGPTISGIIDCRHDCENVLDGYVIEEGAIPEALAHMLEFMLELMPGKEIPKHLTLQQRISHMLAKQGSRFLGPYHPKGSLEKTQVYLIMSHDTNQAYMTLKDDKPVLQFLGVGRSDHVAQLRETLKRATEAVGGTYIDSPFYAALGQQEITVHPIGGACMSSNGTADEGVTNHFGEVFTGRGSETYDGLCVTDAAVIPCALGVNPFATITALAERSVDHMARKKGIRVNLETKNGIINPLTGHPKRGKRQKNDDAMVRAQTLIHDVAASGLSGFEFTEVMSGFIHVGDGLTGDYEKEGYVTAAKTARGLCEAARFFLSVKAWNTEAIVHRADHSAMLTGTFVCAALRGSPFMVKRGDFELFSDDLGASGTKNLRYDFDMVSTDDTILHFHGFKIVDSSVALNPWAFWKAASTLYVTITRYDKNGPVLGRGILNISPTNFLSEVFTLSPHGRNWFARMQSAASFMTYFTKQAVGLFFAPLTQLQYPTQSYMGYINDTQKTETIKVVASDGVKTYMQMWQPPPTDLPVHDLFMIPGAAVDHQIFSLQTIPHNAVNYFTAAGYRVWVITHRIGMTPVAQHNWTTYDARLDIRAALKYIRSKNGKTPVYTIAHCMGAVAFSSGLLDGTIPADWIKGITASQVFMNPEWSTSNMIKVIMPVQLDKAYKTFAGNWFDITSSANDSLVQRAINQVLRFYPDTPAEICNNCACHRGTFVFGRMWNHHNLNEATHRQINRFFGGVNMTLLHLLMQMGARGVVTSNGPLYTDLTTPTNISRIRNIPIMLFSGSDNKVLTPESTERSYGILRDHSGGGGPGEGGGERYERHVIEGYGHLDCWMGTRAYRDVFPRVRGHVDKVVRGDGYRFAG